MDDEDDDIHILPHVSDPSDHHEIKSATHPIIPFFPLSPTLALKFDPGSHHALQTAYVELKRRLEESSSENKLLNKKIKALESIIGRSDGKGTMDETANSPGQVGLQLAAEEGYITNLQRQLARSRTQIEIVEKKYKQKVQETDHQLSSLTQQLQDARSQMEQLDQEKRNLQKICQEQRKEKETALQTARELKEKCDCLEREKEKNIKEEAMLHSALRKAQQELAILKERQGESILTETPAELALEVAHMRKVIKNLKEMVICQRQYLGLYGGKSSLPSNLRSMQPSLWKSMRDPTSVEYDASALGSGRSTGSQPGPSWEMVSSTQPPHPPSLNPRQQQQQLQQQQLKALQNRCVTSSATTLSPVWDPNNAMMTGEPIVNGGVDAGRATISNEVVSPKYWKSQSEIIQRKGSSETGGRRKSKTEVLKPNTSAQYMNTEDILDGDFSPTEGLRVIPQALEVVLSPYQNLTAGLNQFPLDPSGLTESTQGMNSQVKTPELMGSMVPMCPPPQASPRVLKDPNFTFSNGTAAPSMHILNPGIMAGARVIQNQDSFSASRGNPTLAGPTLAAPIQPGFPASGGHVMSASGGHVMSASGGHVMSASGGHVMSASGGHVLSASVSPGFPNPGSAGFSNITPGFPTSGGHRLSPAASPGFSTPSSAGFSTTAPGMSSSGSRNTNPLPQEHVDMSEYTGPVMSELNNYNPQTHTPHHVAVTNAGVGLDRKCPVCSQDFTHVSMDEFQTHVFECFDNAEENSSAPETLQPSMDARKVHVPNDSKFCPMCEREFDGNIPQKEFEVHVQSHFEEAAEQFEVLEVKDT